jgi:type II secretory pathway predicted ATPase ExeA
MKVTQHFGLTHLPLGKRGDKLWDDGALGQLRERFQWLLETPGLGLLSGEAGVGKTAAMRLLTQALNPHRFRVIYLAETDFSRIDLYRHLAFALGLEPAYRRAQLWRDLKDCIRELVDNKQQLPIWVIDEAQNLPKPFFRDLPAFLNFAFDSRDLMTIWLIGHPELVYMLDRAPYAALRSRLQVRVQLKPILEAERFAQLINHAFAQAGCQHTLLSDTGIDMLRQASQGKPRQAGLILKTAMQLALPKGLQHLPDELLREAITSLQ